MNSLAIHHDATRMAVLKHPNVLFATAPAADRFGKPLTDTVFTVLDCEMTGLSLQKDELTEISAIQYKNGQVAGVFSSLVNPALATPGKTIPERVEKLTGITNAMVKDAPPARDVLRALADFVGDDAIIVGDHIAADLAFINRDLRRFNLSCEEHRFNPENTICTQTLAAKAALGPLNDTHAKRLYATATLPAHRAENDVRNCAAFLYELIDILKSLDIPLKTARDLKNYQGPSQPFRSH